MSQGLQLFDDKGSVVVDVNTRFAIALGHVDTLGRDGSVFVSAFSEGTPWLFAIPLGVDSAALTSFTPHIEISGTTLMWRYSESYQKRCVITYGIS